MLFMCLLGHLCTIFQEVSVPFIAQLLIGLTSYYLVFEFFVYSRRYYLILIFLTWAVFLRQVTGQRRRKRIKGPDSYKFRQW